jgi:cystathionine gamma-synthase
MKFETLAVHAGGKPDAATGSIAPPIHLSTTFEHGPAGEQPAGYMYIREGNPTQTRVEEALAAIEGGDAALVFGSGLAAGAAYLQAMPAGSHVVFPDDIYYGFRKMAEEFLPRWGMESSVVDMANLDRVKAALTPKTRLIWAETPSNPLMKITDLAAIAALGRLGRMAVHVFPGPFPDDRDRLELDANGGLVVWESAHLEEGKTKWRKASTFPHLIPNFLQPAEHSPAS